MPESSQDPAQSVRLRVSDAVVALVRQFTGRGPVTTRTTVDRDTVYVFMRGVLSKGESVLVDHGHQLEVLALRRAFQASMRLELSAIIEEQLGRSVVAFMSANHTDPDCAVEIFVLGEPVAEDAPAAAAPAVA